MKILIVDDLNEKIIKIQKVIEETAIGLAHEVFVVNNVADAVGFLFQADHIDLMILDLNLPSRKDEDVKPLSGLNVIKEITRRNELAKPVSIIGLTAKDPVDDAAIKFFQEEAWSLITYDASSSTWELAVANKINYFRFPIVVQPQPTVAKTNICYFSSSPKDQGPLSTGTEQRRISDTIRSSTFRDDYDFTPLTGGTFDNFSRTLISSQPAILHISGHGDQDGFAMEDALGSTKYIPFKSIEMVLKQISPHTKCVLLSACYSADQAQTISATGIYAIGIDHIAYGEVTENFAVGFYQAVGENKTFQEAFQMGLAHASISEEYQSENIKLYFQGNQID